MKIDDPTARREGGSDPLQHSETRFRLLVDSVQDYAIFMLDPEGRVLTWNAGAQRLKQYEAAEIIGRSFSTFYPPEALASGWPQEELRRARRLGRFEDEGWRVRKDGSRFWANVVLTALHGEDGTLQGFAKVTRDLTERRHHEELLRRSEEQLRVLLDSVTDYAIYMLDPQGRILTWNAGASRITGYAADAVLGQRFALFFTAEDVANHVPEHELATARLHGHAQNEGWRVKKDGSQFWASAVITSIFDADGTLRGYAKVTRDMTEQRRAQEMEQSSRRLHEFIAMLAHELRNPLAPISNAANILSMQQGLPAAVARAGTIVGRQSALLTRLVDDLLDVGRMVSGKITLKTAVIDLRDVVQLSVEAIRPLIEQRRHQLSVDLPATELRVDADEARLSQVLQNLLHNAARYTPEQGRISLTAAADAGDIVLTISDSGIGIDPAVQERIFELFMQGDDQAASNGLGIGLSLARMLTEQHGGRLTVHSAGRGHGSSFTLNLPASTSETAAAPLPTPDAPSAVAASCRVLVADDNEDSVESITELLGLIGQQARGVYGAQAALAAAREFEPHLLLLDLNMPDGDGFSVITQIRRETSRPIYIVAMTGYGQRSDIERTRLAGFDDHLTKPCSLEQIEQVLARAAELRLD